MQQEDTICAISTAPGVGGIAVVRVSGEKAIDITEKIFVPHKRGKKLRAAKSQSLTYGNITDNTGKVVDDVLVAVFREPHSYTGEDSTEISCHGSLYIQQKIVQLLIENGCRMATAGEFTKRAFLNGKMDLSQAEAVADLIAANTEASHQVALNQMRGGISHELKKLRADLVDFVSLIELELDFSEEDVEFASRERLKEKLDEISTKIDRLTNSFKVGNAIKNGIPVAIIGQTNVGKSTLLNLLLDDDKAIVSDVQGTTRDVIEDTFVYKGKLYRIIDTAGLRETNDKIEKLGIERSYKKMEEAAIVLLLLDGSDDPNKATAFVEENQKRLEGKKTIIVVNKTDQTPVENRQKLTETLQDKNPIFVSAKYGENKDALLERIAQEVQSDAENDNDVVVTNLRHYEALCKAQEAVKRIDEGLELSLSGDLLSRDIHDCIDALGEITGEISNDEVLGNIFSHFCIGK